MHRVPSPQFRSIVLPVTLTAPAAFKVSAPPDSMVMPLASMVILLPFLSLSVTVWASSSSTMVRPSGVLTVIDNTWGCGLLYAPLALGVDVSLQALTKYVGGHSDVFMGSACSLDPEVLKQIDAFLRDFGLAVSPDGAYLMLRGLRTLEVRLKRHGENALKVAAWLQQQSEVRQVLCPALPGAPGHELWKRDFKGSTGLFGVELKPASN